MSAFIDKPKELIILTEHFSPSTGATAQLVFDLAEDLHCSGVRLRVLTSTAGSTDYAYPVLRFSGSDSSAIGVLKKLINGLIFFGGSAVWLLANIHQNQSLLIVSNPPFIGLIGVLLSTFKKTSYVFLFQDIFPRSASLTGILPAQGPLILFWRLLLNAVLSRSRATVVLSSAMAKRCHLEFDADTRLESIPNWAIFPPHSTSKEQSSLATQWNIQSSFTVQYSGNFGRLHEIMTILESARLLQDNSVRFLFVGDGAKAVQINRYCSTYGLKNIITKPYQVRSLLSDSLAACDLAIVSLIPGAEDTVAPSKFYGIIASSRPVILISSEDSELSSLITQFQCGVVVPQGDVLKLSETIVHLQNNKELVMNMGRNARELYEQKYGRSRSVSQYYRLFKQYGMI